MSKIEYKYPVDVLVAKIFKIYHILSESSAVSSEESTPLVLLLLSMFKDGQIHSQSLNNHDSFEKFQETIDRLLHEQNKNHQYQAILQIMQHSLSKVNIHTYNRICHIFCELDDKFLKENFAKVFDDVLYRVSRSQGRYAGEFIQPVELTRLMIGLAGIKKDAKIFNPFAGLSSFSVYLDKEQDYFGQEKIKTTWALGALRLMAYERPETTRYVCDDSILRWPEPAIKFDCIITSVPLNLPIKDLNIHGKFIHIYSRVEQFLIEKSLENLAEDGKLIALLPISVLDRSFGSEHIVQNLIGKDLIDNIILLPAGLLMNTEVSIVILVLNKAKKHPNKVKFVNGKKFVLTNNLKVKTLDEVSLINSVLGDINDDEVVRIIDNEQIIANDYNLSVLRYFRKQIDGVKLGDILEQVRGQRGNLPETGKLIRIRDLKDDKVDFTLDISGIEEAQLRRPDIHLVSESCLLLALRWRTLKPTLLISKGNRFFRSQDILSFKINESIADKSYLINELHSEYVQEQLDSYRIGASIMPRYVILI
ncbi:MAG: N-6 DNA methylase [Saprospiraceae bacterium]|nr:N-6 DNA methylase [Saprospiraceae bacterium]